MDSEDTDDGQIVEALSSDSKDDRKEAETIEISTESDNTDIEEVEGKVQIILEKVPESESENKDNSEEEVSEKQSRGDEVPPEVDSENVEAVTVKDDVKEDSVSGVVTVNQAESSHLGKLLEDKLEDVVRRSSTEEEDLKVQENDKLTSEQSPHKDSHGSLKRKLDQVENHHRRDKERSEDDKSRSKDHKKSSRDRDRDGERRHRDKERSHHDRDKHRDRKRDKKSTSSVGLQCNLETESNQEKSSLIFPDGHDDPPSVRLCGYSMANPLHSLAGIREYKYAHLMYLELYANGGGKILHAWQEDVDKLSEKESMIFAEEFLKEAFIEDRNNLAMYCAAIVHNAAKGLPDFLEYLGDEHPNLPVKHGVIGHPRELETTTMSVYRDKVHDHYGGGTFRFGHLDNLSLVGTASEEAGGFFPDILDMLDEIPILSLTMPWGPHSILHDKLDRNKSNDGPILWIRPGEQSIPTAELGKSPLKRRRGNAAINELQNLKYLPRSNGEREVVIEDRTPAHADHVGFGFDRMTTAAVGVLKAVRCGQYHGYNRVTKDTVIFSAQSFAYLSEKLQLDLHEPPMSQCLSWLEESKLNLLHREGVTYARVPLADNDIYFLPRNIIHQFRTVAATCSIAWHVRLKPYYDTPPPTAAPVSESSEMKTGDLGIVKHESGSGSEKENDLRPEKKRKRTSSSDSEGGLDPDFEPKIAPKCTKTVDVKKEHSKEHKEKRRDKEKKKKKDKDRDKDREKERSKDYEKHKSDKYKEKDKEKSHHHHHHQIKKEKSEKSESKLSFKLVEQQSFEKLMSEVATTGSVKKSSEKPPTSEERRNMSQLFPGQLKAESVKKKLALTPQTSPKVSLNKPHHKPSEPNVKKPPEQSPVKKILNFDNPSKNVNLLDTIMANMSFPANKE